jgi:hypothetical protein
LEVQHLRIYATKEFMRFARREGIDNQALKDAAERAIRGIIDADLHGGLIKQRVPRKGQGRSGGFRTLAAFRGAHRCVFLYGFAKNKRANIDDDELAKWRKVANAFLNMNPDKLTQLIEADDLIEVV